MLVYLGLDFMIIIFGLLVSRYKAIIRNNKVDNIKWMYIVSFILLFFVSAFRGDFSADYHGYEEIYLRFFSYTLGDLLKRPLLFSNPETGYLILQKIIQMTFDNVLYVFIVSSFIIVFCNLYVLKRESVLPFLGLFLYLEVGGYYQSFNLMRQALAIAILLLGTRYLIERKVIKYFIVVFLACTFHTVAIIMIPFYFISTVRISKKNILFYPTIIIVFLFLQGQLTTWLLQYFWSWYDTGALQGYSWKNVVLPLFVAGIGLFLYYFDAKKKKDRHLEITKTGKDTNSNQETIFLNGTVFYILFQLAGLINSIAQRFSFPFCIYLICFVCLQVKKSKYKSILIGFIVLFLLLAEIIIQMDSPYYFIWSRVYRRTARRGKMRVSTLTD